MGHSDKIHKDHYRQPLASRDILKISQYLEAVQGNTNNQDEDLSANSNSENDEKENSLTDNNMAEEGGICTNNYFCFSICISNLYILYISLYVCTQKFLPI